MTVDASGSSHRERALKALAAEAQAIARITLDASFDAAVELLLRVGGQRGQTLIVSGLGKSGLIGAKLAATFASTGTPSQFMHPVEAMHGDLGVVKRGDVVLLLSYSGATAEIVALAEVLRQDGAEMIAIVGPAVCDLARLVTVTLPVGDVTEACPMNLAPTASTTAMLALGDALALAVSQARQFGVDDFRKFHPGGALGKQLLPVTSVMRFKAGENLPLIPHSASIQRAYELATPRDPNLRRAGALLIVDESGRLAGIFTDGDLRRLVFAHDHLDRSQPIGRVMTRSPATLNTHHLVRDAVSLVRERRIDEIPILNEAGQPVGLIDVQDLMALKVMQG